MNRRTSVMAAAFLGCLVLSAQANAVECTGGLFGVAAQIVRIDPSGAKAVKLQADRHPVDVGLNDFICAGETLIVELGGKVVSVELFADGSKKTVRAGSRFTSSASVGSGFSRALGLLSDAMRTADNVRPAPDIPQPTAARGKADPANAGHLRAMAFVDSLPPQKLTTDTSALLSWRDGLGPYVCAAVSDRGDEIAPSEQPPTASWCAASHNASSPQLIVRDRRNHVVSWLVSDVDWNQVPRPAQLAGSVSSFSNADRTAWAWWLWNRPDAEWRLQALGMLNGLAGEVWLAGYLRDNILSDVVEFSPR